MRTSWRLLAALALILTTADAARAGVYDLEEVNPWVPPMPYSTFRLKAGDLRSVALDPPFPQNQEPKIRADYVARINRLEELLQKGGATVADRVTLSACYLRRSKPDLTEKAVQVLTPVERAAGRHRHLVLANLASAHAQAGRLDLAVRYQEQALSAWPSLSLDWSDLVLRWYRYVERFQLTVWRSRLEETRRQPGRPPESVDPLFPGLRFVGPSGDYEPGDLAADQRDRMPGDAHSVVMQLLWWQPFDDRLAWLLGELLNASGDVVSAADLLDDLVRNRGATAVRELRQHRLVLKEAALLRVELNGPRGGVLLEQILWALAPRGGLTPPGVGPLASEAGLTATADVLTRPETWSDATQIQTPPVPPAKPTDGMPDWRTILVSFFCGGLAAWFIGMQFRAGRRR